MTAPAAPDRRRFALLAAAAAAGLAVPALRAQPRLERPRLQLAVGGKSAFWHLPLTVADQLGYFRAEGLDLEITDVGSDARALQALAGGTADIVGVGYEQMISLQARNQFIEAFVLQARAPQVAMGVSLKAMPAYQSVADLRGRRVGVSVPGSATSMVASLVLARGGLRPGDVTFVGVGNAAGALAALRSGQIDALSNTDPVMTMLEQRADVRIIGDTRTLKGTQEVFGGLMPAACLGAALEFVQRHPNTCQALANALVHGLKWLQTAGPGDIIKTVPEPYLLGDRALYLAAFNKVREAISLDGLLPEEGARTALRVLAGFDASVRPERVDLSRTYTNEFARRAKDKFKA